MVDDYFDGIYLGEQSNYNRIFKNSITENDCGIDLLRSSNNTIYHNNFIKQLSTSECAGSWIYERLE
jgi:parallel beta-helix repeat protein